MLDKNNFKDKTHKQCGAYSIRELYTIALCSGERSVRAREPATIAVAPGAISREVGVPSSHCTVTSGPMGVRTARRHPTRGGGMA